MGLQRSQIERNRPNNGGLPPPITGSRSRARRPHPPRHSQAAQHSSPPRCRDTAHATLLRVTTLPRRTRRSRPPGPTSPLPKPAPIFSAVLGGGYIVQHSLYPIYTIALKASTGR